MLSLTLTFIVLSLRCIVCIHVTSNKYAHIGTHWHTVGILLEHCWQIESPTDMYLNNLPRHFLVVILYNVDNGYSEISDQKTT